MPTRANRKFKGFFRKIWMPLAILIILVAIITTTFRALTPWANEYKPQMEVYLTQLIGQKVTINEMETSWHWFEPVIKLNKITLTDTQGQVLTLNKLLVGIDILRSLRHWQIMTDSLYFDDVYFSVEQTETGWHIDGINNQKQQIPLTSNTYTSGLNWLSTQQKIVLNNISGLVRLQDGSLIPLDDLSLFIKKESDHYKLQINTRLPQTTETHITFSAEVKLDPDSPTTPTGSLYIEADKFIPAQWQGLLKNNPIKLEGGQGDLAIWLDIDHGKLTTWQGQLHFENLAWHRPNHQKSQLIQSIEANLGWKRSDKGWNLSGDKIELRADGVSWPENTFEISYDKGEETHDIFIEHVLIDSVLATDFIWPKQMKPILKHKVTGTLKHTKITTHEHEMRYFLTRFDNLGWQGDKRMPRVQGISGVIHWQPDQGHLVLDSHNTDIQPNALPTVQFSQIAASINWKELSHGLRLSVEDLVLTTADDVFTATGFIDNPNEPEETYLNLSAKFSGHHVEKWIPYLLTTHLKPKLAHWLQNNIKEIGTLSAQANVNGKTKDFPFDNTEGTFSILSHIDNVDVGIDSKWPLNRNLSGYLRVNKRDLTADIRHAKINGTGVNDINLRIDNIGLNHERLLLHTNLAAYATDIKRYIFASPLKQHLARLEQLKVKGLLGLDLQLEIPLYSTSDKILVQGALTFNNNNVALNDSFKSFSLKKVTGSLDFTETGITDSKLHGVFLGYPTTVHVASYEAPNTRTEVTMQSKANIEILKQKLKLPVLNLVTGQLGFTSKLVLTDNPNDLDQLYITSDLQGTAINLPSPLNKPSKKKTPFDLAIEFNAEKAMRVRLDYANRLSSDLWFEKEQDAFDLKKGELRFGGGHANSQKQPGIQIVGSLPTLNIPQWQEVLSKISSNDDNKPLYTKIHFIDLKIAALKLFDQTYQNVLLKGVKLDHDNWSIDIQQKHITADLRYDTKTNTLTGNVPYLHLSKKLVKKAEQQSTQTHLQPQEIPNLNLAIETLVFDEISLGSASLKSESTLKNWVLHEAGLKSAYYDLNLSGEWIKHDGVNHTQINGNLKINNFTKTLAEWNIHPSVEARQGNIRFQSNWPGNMTDVSLKKMQGDLKIKIKNGRIIHLTPEAEQKIGLGKLLSILSLQTIPRRLQLDFSDISKPGYSFDEFNGDFKLKHGIMKTQNSYIDGPIAYASMTGSLNLEKKLYDLNLHISPHIAASLPIVATIAGGPIAGIATWVASKIISKGMQKVSGYTYKITGPWENPTVQQLNIYRKR